MWSRQDTFEKVAGKLVDAILAGDGSPAAWRKPWTALAAAHAEGTRPRNVDGRAYQGVNAFVLGLEALSRDLPQMPWATFKRWQASGANVRKGEKGVAVIFWKSERVKVQGADGEEEGTKRRLLLRSYVVFHASQVDGWKGADKWRSRYTPQAVPAVVPVLASSAAADAAVAGYINERSKGLMLEHRGDRAAYSPALHAVRMPERHAFKASAGYYATLLHELVHSTGHKSLLDRDQTGGFGSDAYAKEELVAEAGAAMLCGILDVPAYDKAEEAQHLAYIVSWMKSVSRGTAAEAIVMATQRAKKAAELIAGVQEAEVALAEAA